MKKDDNGLTLDDLHRFLDAQKEIDAEAEDIRNCYEDNDGCIYSQSGKYLIKCKNRDIQEKIIPEGVRQIMQNAFDGCEKLSKVMLSQSLEVIGGCAFAKCCNLKTIIIPQKVESIQQGVFAMSGVKNVVSESEKIKVINDCLIDTKTQTLLHFLSDEDSVQIPNGIRIIGAYAFYTSNVKSVVFPEGVVEISNEVFSPFSHKLNEMTFPSTLDRIIDGDDFGDWFWHIVEQDNVVIHVPANAIDKIVEKHGDWIRKHIALVK